VAIALYLQLLHKRSSTVFMTEIETATKLSLGLTKGRKLKLRCADMVKTECIPAVSASDAGASTGIYLIKKLTNAVESVEANVFDI